MSRGWAGLVPLCWVRGEGEGQWEQGWAPMPSQFGGLEICHCLWPCSGAELWGGHGRAIQSVRSAAGHGPAPRQVDSAARVIPGSESMLLQQPMRHGLCCLAKSGEEIPCSLGLAALACCICHNAEAAATDLHLTSPCYLHPDRFSVQLPCRVALPCIQHQHTA